jgi:hypothetical protein
VETSAIIPEFDVTGNVILRLFPCRIDCPVDTLDFQRSIKRFRQAAMPFN